MYSRQSPPPWLGLPQPSSDAVITPVPVDELRNALVDRRGRVKTKIGPDCVDVGEGVGNVARLERMKLDHRLASDGLLDQADHPPQLLGAVIADIVQPVWRPAPTGLDLPVV